MRSKNSLIARTILFGVFIICFLFLAGRQLPRKKAGEPLQAVSEKEIQETIQRTMVQVVAGNLKGSGVIYGETEYTLVIITAAHVLELAEDTVEVTFWDGMAAETGMWQTASDADLAFIQVSLEQLTRASDRDSEDWDREASYEKVIADRDSFDKLRPGDSILIADAREGAAAGIYEGTLTNPWIYLEDFSQYMLLAQARAAQGMSGGGVFDGEGRFIGILCGTGNEGELAVLPFSIIEAGYSQRF